MTSKHRLGLSWDGVWEQPPPLFACPYTPGLLLLEMDIEFTGPLSSPVQPSMRLDSCLLLGVISKDFP